MASKMIKKRVSAFLVAGTSLAAGVFALNSNFSTTAAGVSGTGTEKDLATSQNTEQQLMDSIRAAQKDVQAALTARTAAINKYANATGSATLQVQSRKIAAPKTQAKTGASGGAKENEKEFEDD
jgi:hypothetical protein